MRNNDGTFAKGNNLSKGRPKGSKNKQTEGIRKFFIDFVDQNKESLKLDFEMLDPKDRFKYIFEMAKFFLPSLKAIEFGNVLDEMSETDFETLMQKLKKEYEI